MQFLHPLPGQLNLLEMNQCNNKSTQLSFRDIVIMFVILNGYLNTKIGSKVSEVRSKKDVLKFFTKFT